MAEVGLCALAPFSVLEFDMAGPHTGFVHGIAIVVCSYVFLPCSVQEWFCCWHPHLLAFGLFPAPSTEMIPEPLEGYTWCICS